MAQVISLRKCCRITILLVENFHWNLCSLRLIWSQVLAHKAQKSLLNFPIRIFQAEPFETSNNCPLSSTRIQTRWIFPHKSKWTVCQCRLFFIFNTTLKMSYPFINDWFWAAITPETFHKASMVLLFFDSSFTINFMFVLGSIWTEITLFYWGVS